MAAAAGADNFGHMGISGADQAASLDVLVLQHEVISFIESVMREIEFSEELLALRKSRRLPEPARPFSIGITRWSIFARNSGCQLCWTDSIIRAGWKAAP